MAQPLLDIKDLTTVFPLEGPSRGSVSQMAAVDGLDLQVQPGQVLGLVGESGCGNRSAPSACWAWFLSRAGWLAAVLSLTARSS